MRREEEERLREELAELAEMVLTIHLTTRAGLRRRGWDDPAG